MPKEKKEKTKRTRKLSGYNLYYQRQWVLYRQHKENDREKGEILEKDSADFTKHTMTREVAKAWNKLTKEEQQEWKDKAKALY